MLAATKAGLDARLAALPPPVRTAWKWDILTGLLAGAYQGSIWTFVPRVARAELHASNAQMGWIAAAPALGYLFATLWARQMEGKSKLPFVYWTWLFARGGFMLTPLLLQSTGQFVALVCLTPFIFSISMPAYTAVMKEIYPDRHRGRLMSLVRMLMSTTTFVTALVCGRLFDHHMDWRIGFAVGGMFGAMSAWTFSRIPVSHSAGSDEDPVSTLDFLRDTFGILTRNPGFRWFSASVFVSGFGNIVATTLYPIYQVDQFHVTNTQVANLQNLSAIGTIVGYFFWGGFLDRRGPLSTVLASLLFNLAAPVLYAEGWGMGALYVAAAAMGICVSGVDLAYLNTTILFAEPGKTAQYQALHSSFFGLRGSIAPHCAVPLMAWLGPEKAFLTAFFIICGGVGLQMISMRDYRREHRRERELARQGAKA